MLQEIQQLALVEALLTNWDGIRMRMEPLSASAADELARLGRRLGEAASADELARIIDDLLDFTMNTAANSYVRELVARSTLAKVTPGVRAAAPPAPAAPPPPPSPEAAVQTLSLTTSASRSLAKAVSSDAGFVTTPVFFGTNRQRGPGAGETFLGEPAESLSFGLAEVTIPVAKHRIGKVETPRWWTLFPNRNPESRFITIADIEPMAQAAFCSKLASAIATSTASDLLIFLHGYNVTFEEAARRAAQFSYDLGFQGVVILFSWPSLGSLLRYPADEDRAAASSEALAQFLRVFEGGPWRRVHLVAHSMGNRVMLLGLADNPRPSLSFGQIVFVAADVYVDVFAPKWRKLLDAGALPATSYTSKRDKALFISDFLHKADRIGFIEGAPYVTDGMDTIDASAVDTSFLGHGYFADERSLLTDLGILIRQGLAPAERGLRAAPAGKYWIFPD
jgi:esterase/lipase superfamily enzyme